MRALHCTWTVFGREPDGRGEVVGDCGSGKRDEECARDDSNDGDGDDGMVEVAFKGAAVWRENCGMKFKFAAACDG